MKLEAQVCSLDLAKRLKELGIKQESLWWWCFNPNYENWVLLQLPLERVNLGSGLYISAFTVAELGEMLPCFLGFERRIKYQKDVMGAYILHYYNCEQLKQAIREINEANARAKMVIYLKEKGILEKQ